MLASAPAEASEHQHLFTVANPRIQSVHLSVWRFGDGWIGGQVLDVFEFCWRTRLMQTCVLASARGIGKRCLEGWTAMDSVPRYAELSDSTTPGMPGKQCGGAHSRCSTDSTPGSSSDTFLCHGQAVTALLQNVDQARIVQNLHTCHIVVNYHFVPSDLGLRSLMLMLKIPSVGLQRLTS